MIDSVTWKIGGEAGFGIMSSGTMLARAFTRAGYHILATNEYPSLIRGGHNVVTVRVASYDFSALNKDVHILIALNKETITLHKDELSPDAIVVFDPGDSQWKAEDFPKPVQLVPVPLLELVNKHNADRIMRNTVALGASIALMGADFKILEDVIKDQFKKKKPEVAAENITMAKEGYDAVKTQFSSLTGTYLSQTTKKEEQLLLNASEALGVGAVRAGMKFAAIYPMTPINSLITFLADHSKEFQVVYKQPEDEIAGINMAIGASVAGVRSMVASSGGGFALMVEGVSLAGIMEAPLVVDVGMRVGPATGMPTWTEQADLQFVIHSGHGEFPKIVLAAGDAVEAYELVIQAFHLADKYQTPVFILSDKYINESTFGIPKSVCSKPITIDRGKLLLGQELPADGSFKRYDLSVTDGISPRSVPGMKGGQFYSNSYEHDEIGSVTEKPEVRTHMAAKRLKKYDAIKSDIIAPSLYGSQEADVVLVGWGSTKGPIQEAIKILHTQGHDVKFVHYTWLYPFPTEQTVAVLQNAKCIIDIENNATAQLASLIAEHALIRVHEKILKYDGRPFFPEDIAENVIKLAFGGSHG